MDSLSENVLLRLAVAHLAKHVGVEKEIPGFEKGHGTLSDFKRCAKENTHGWSQLVMKIIARIPAMAPDCEHQIDWSTVQLNDSRSLIGKCQHCEQDAELELTGENFIWD